MAAATLTERQKQILMLLVQEYIRTGRPVASAALVERYRLPYSPATVRNEFATLSRKGYLDQPHTSAGRVPTPKAYRFVVEAWKRLGAPSLHLQEAVRRRIRPGRHVQDWLAQAAAVLAEHIHVPAWVMPPRMEKARCERVRLYPWNGRRVLLVVSLQGGWIRERVVTMPSGFTSEDLRGWQRYLQTRCRGKSSSELTVLPPPEDPQRRALWEAVLDEVDRAQRLMDTPLFAYGLRYVLETEAATPAVTLLEEEPRLEDMVRRWAATLPVGEVRVIIGGTEEAPADLAGCAVVVGRYGARAAATGFLGVLGPLRMPYNEAVPAVRFVSRWLTRLFQS